MGIPLAQQKAAYGKAMKKDWKGLVEFYKNDGVSVLLPISITKDCGLHFAVQSKRAFPLDKLLEIAFPTDEERNVQPELVGNGYGNTALHLAATIGNYEAIKLLVSKFPMLVANVNAAGETPLFVAASFGETEIVKYLAEQHGQIVNGKLEDHHRKRSDGTSILHIAVQGEHFDTALQLLDLDKSLAELKDKNDMTAFHLLANTPAGFRSGYSKGLFTWLFYYCLPVEDYTPASVGNERDNRNRCRGYLQTWHQFCLNIKKALKWIYLWNCKFLFQGWPILKKVWDEKRKHVRALELAKVLIKSDISWLLFVQASETSSGIMTTLSYDSITRPDQSKINIERPEKDDDTKIEKKSSFEAEKDVEHIDDQGRNILNIESDDMKGENKLKYTQTPLFIATENGITEIVKEFLIEYPQAVEHIDDKGRNILHVAIMHRRRHIFDFVKKNSMPLATLKLGVDNDGYTLLHYAADTEHYSGGSKPGPALQLQEELQWFERVREIVPSHYASYRSKDPKGTTERKSTAWELLKEKHKEQLKQAQGWVKDTSQSCSTVAVLIATVVFAAAYTVPGGYEENKGTPIFLHSPYFLFFTIMDVISLACSLTSVVMFLSILTSPFEIQEFRHSLPRKLMFGFTLLFLSVVTTMLTFGATILLTVHLEQKLTASLLYIAAFFPVLVFALMQFRLYIAFLGTLKDFINDIRKSLPSCFLPSLRCKDKLN